MATLIIHGTMTVAASPRARWWWDSWNEGGFLDAMARGMDDASGGHGHDVWQVGGVHVSELDRLKPRWSLWRGRIGQIAHHRGHFFWDGADMYGARQAAANNLVKYLNVVWDLLGEDEPLRLVAHSHGANVVKMASSHTKLRPDLMVQRAVFLGCPHFMAQWHKEPHFPYRIDPRRFGEVLNLWSDSDTVQVGFADAIPGPPGARPSDFLPPKAHCRDPDEGAEGVYRDFAVPTEDQETKAHTALHGQVVGYLVGGWLDTGMDFGRVIENAMGQGLPVPRGDFGA